MEKYAISVSNLVKTYKLYNKPNDRLKEAIFPFIKSLHTDFYALKQISFNISIGETIGIIGKNGSGKSTLLKILTGVLTPTDGNVKINGKIAALLELGAGFNPELTGLENIYITSIIMGYTKNDIDKRIDDILSFADIGNFIHQPVKIYSSGMFARLAFAVAINVDPDILIIDEALAVGDIAFQIKCFKKFKDFKEQGKTILFVSHDLSSILKLCDRCILMSNGNIFSMGDTKTVVDDYKKLLAHLEDDIICTKSINTQTVSSNWKKHMNNNPDVLEYGNHKIQIIDYGIFDDLNNPIQIIQNSEKIYIKMIVKIISQVDDPIFAFTIKDLQGNEICGTNTYYEGIDTSFYKSGDVLSISFTQTLNLKKGMYTVSFGTTQFTNNKLEIFHRLYDACFIEINTVKDIVGIFDINSHIDISII